MLKQNLKVTDILSILIVIKKVIYYYCYFRSLNILRIKNKTQKGDLKKRFVVKYMIAKFESSNFNRMLCSCF